MSKKPNKKNDIEAIIKKAVEEGIDAGRKQAERAPADAYRATERRLYALPVLAKKVEDTKERLKELRERGAPARSKDVIRFQRFGVIMTPAEILDGMIADIESTIAADEHEIETVNTALEQIKDDEYFLAVKGRYIDQVSDAEIAKQIPCDERTVRRHRGRLVRVVAIWLYGAEAV